MVIEHLEKKLTRVNSILMLLSSDLDNPAGSCVESIQQEALSIALETLDSAINMLHEK